MITLITLLSIFVLQSKTYADNYRIPFPQDVISTIGTYPQSTLPRQIDILVWNAYKAKINGWETDYKKLIKDKELGLIQEYHAQRMTFIENDLQGGYDLAVSFYMPFKNVATGVTTFSVANPAITNFERSFYREPVTNTPKVSLITHYNFEDCDHQLLVINTHAINFVGAKKWQHQMDRLSKLIEQHQGPVIWGGDFNTWSETKLKSLELLVEKLGLTLINEYENDQRHRMFGNPIDHVLYRQLELKKAKVPNEIKTSDHAPMEVSFHHDCT